MSYARWGAVMKLAWNTPPTNLMEAIQARLNLVLHDNQRVIHNSPARNKVIKAGKRFGKTKWLLYALLQKAGERPNQVIWYVAPTYRQAKNIAWLELSWLLPRQLVRRSVENELYKELINGSQLRLLGSDNQDSLRGTKIHALGIDEAAYVDAYAWFGILSSQLLGNAQEGGRGAAYFISSPNRKGKNWFSDFWDEAKRLQDKGDKDWAAFKYTIHDNPTMLPEDILKEQERTPDDTWKVEYLAEESDYAGPLFGEFNYGKHVAETPETGMVYVRAIDWGIDHPTVCLLLGVNYKEKKVYVLDEFFRTGMVIQESCNAILQMTGQRPVEWTVIDPSCNKRNSQTGRTDKDEFHRWGVPCLAGDNKDRGYDITKMFFKKDMIQISPKCKNLIYQLKNVQRGDKEGDDATDALRYACVQIHDRMFGMNVFDSVQHDNSKWVHSRECSFEDPNLFPQEKKEISSWILEEINDAA